MSTLRFLREFSMLLAVIGGAVIGFFGGQNFGPTVQLICSFLGMASFGAFADICLRGEK